MRRLLLLAGLLGLLACPFYLPTTDAAPPVVELAQAPEAQPEAAPVADQVHARGYKAPANLEQMKKAKFSEHGRRFKALMEKALPAQYISPYQVAQQNQGACGDCWCVSASVCASMAFIANGTFSPKATDGSNVITANSTLWCKRTGGCNGDDASTVFDFGKSNGLATIACYGPYRDTDRGNCNDACPKFKLTAWGYADENGDGSTSYDECKAAIYQYGCVVLTNDAGALGDGTRLVTSRGNGTDHQIVGVGWDDTMNNGQGAILGKNQWAASWGLTINGDGGYVWIANLGTRLAASCSSEVLWCEAGTGPLPPGVAPVFTSGPLPNALTGSPYAFTFTASGTPAPTFTSVPTKAGQFPLGLMLTADGQVSGEPLNAGTYNFTVTASNSAGTATQACSLLVSDTGPTPVGPVKAELTGTVLENGVIQLDATGSTPIKSIVWKCKPADAKIVVDRFVDGSAYVMPTKSDTLIEVAIYVTDGKTIDQDMWSVTVNAPPAPKQTSKLDPTQAHPTVQRKAFEQRWLVVSDGTGTSAQLSMFASREDAFLDLLTGGKFWLIGARTTQGAAWLTYAKSVGNEHPLPLLIVCGDDNQPLQILPWVSSELEAQLVYGRFDMPGRKASKSPSNPAPFRYDSGCVETEWRFAA